LNRLLDKRGVIFKTPRGISYAFISFALIAEDRSLQQATSLLGPFILLSVSIEQGTAY